MNLLNYGLLVIGENITKNNQTDGNIDSEHLVISYVQRGWERLKTFTTSDEIVRKDQPNEIMIDFHRGS